MVYNGFPQPKRRRKVHMDINISSIGLKYTLGSAAAAALAPGKATVSRLVGGRVLDHQVVRVEAARLPAQVRAFYARTLQQPANVVWVMPGDDRHPGRKLSCQRAGPVRPHDARTAPEHRVHLDPAAVDRPALRQPASTAAQRGGGNRGQVGAGSGGATSGELWVGNVSSLLNSSRTVATYRSASAGPLAP